MTLHLFPRYRVIDFGTHHGVVIKGSLGVAISAIAAGTFYYRKAICRSTWQGLKFIDRHPLVIIPLFVGTCILASLIWTVTCLAILIFGGPPHLPRN